MKRLTNDDVKRKYGYPRELKIDGTYTNINFSPKRKLKNDLHWTVYIYDGNQKKQVWREIDKEENINAAKRLSKKMAIEYYLKNIIYVNKPTKQNISSFLVGQILEKYTESFTREQYKKIDSGKKLKSTVMAHIACKESNRTAIDDFFGHKDIRQLEESDFERFMKKRLKEVGKGSIGNSLSFFSTALNHTLNRNAGKRRTRAIIELNAELSRLIVVIRFFRKDNELTVQDILKESKENKTNGHGRIEYFKFKEIIEWLRGNEKIDDVFPDFYEFLYWQSNRVGEASKLQGRNIIMEGDTVKLKVPSILTKTGTGGLFSLHPDIEDIFRRRKKDIQDEDFVFSVVNSKTHERQEMTPYFFRKVWKQIKVKFDLRLKDGRYMTPHVLRHSCINNLGDSMRANVQAFTNQSDDIVKHYMSDETQNKNELFQLLAWQNEMEQEVIRQNIKAGEKKLDAITDVIIDKDYYK